MTSYVPWPARKLRSEYDSVGPDAWDRPSGTHTAVAVFGSLWLTKIA